MMKSLAIATRAPVMHPGFSQIPASMPGTRLCRSVLCGVLFAGAGGAFAQAVLPGPPLVPGVPIETRAGYDRRIASCDHNEPRPQYEACVRAAGIALDNAGVSAIGNVPIESKDGRAKIYVSPAQARRADGSSDEVVPTTTTSSDGRATLLVPSDSTLRGALTRP